MIGGFVVGLIRFGLEFGYNPPICGSGLPDTRPEIVLDLVDRFHFLHFGGFNFALTCILAFLMAPLTQPIPEDRVIQNIFFLYT